MFPSKWLLILTLYIYLSYKIFNKHKIYTDSFDNYNLIIIAIASIREIHFNYSYLADDSSKTQKHH